jgi:OHCU decarboxylase
MSLVPVTRNIHASAEPHGQLVCSTHTPNLLPRRRDRALTQDSTAEQGSVGLDRMSSEDFTRFDRLNAAYRERFGFPFIIAVRGRTKHEIWSAFEQRLRMTQPSSFRRRLMRSPRLRECGFRTCLVPLVLPCEPVHPGRRHVHSKNSCRGS